jgi:hypothetical protein
VLTCHCSDCQTLTTSAFSLNGFVRSDTLEITQGEIKTWIRTAESGNRIPQNVCANCGVRIFTQPGEAEAPTRTLRLGTLDDTSWLRPAAAIWLKSAQPWVSLPNDMLRYEAGAADLRPIVERWRALMGLD